MRKVQEMRKQAQKNNSPLLSNYPSDFWAEYRNNYARYDDLFNRMYRGFAYFMQEPAEPIADITENFTNDVYNHLLVNDKKYSELFRINSIDDDDYSLLNNYDVTETMQKSTSENGSVDVGARSDSQSYTKGAQTDSASMSYGQKTTTSTDKVAPYDSDVFNNNSENSVIEGARSDTSNTIEGSRSDSTSTSLGAQHNTHADAGTENYTLTRVGNIGVMTATDLLDKHDKFWKAYNFYAMIFNDICRELLLLV